MSYNRASEDLKKLGKYLSGIIEFASVLDKMESFDESYKQSLDRLEKSRGEELALNEKLQKLNKEALSLMAENKNKREFALAEVDNMLKEANKKSHELISGAEKKAQELINDAEGKVKSILSNIDKLNEDKKQAEKDAAEQQRKLYLINLELDKLKSKL